MKKLLLFAAIISISTFLTAQNIVFSDNFESSTTNWSLSGSWGLSTSSSHSATHSLSESPSGNYANNLNYITATMYTGVDLTSALSADLSFWAKYNIEAGFDYMYVDVSANGGTTWVNIASFDGVLTTWTQFNYSLGGYVGNSNVKVRFRFYSDGAVNFDGMYIDDFVITSDTVDNASPLVLHTAPVFYDGTSFQDSVMADLIDISGISTAELMYSVDGGSYTTISGSNTSGDTYKFVIPQQQSGAMVDYYFKAVDNAPTSNTEITDTFSFIAGNYVAYDNGQVDFVDSTGIGNAVAMRVSISTATNLDGILIRNYTDPNRPNDSMLVHVWNNASGLPGTDIITPFKVMPMATLQNTSAMTTIDLRPYATQLSNLTSDIYIGFSVPSGGVWCTITRPGTANRSFKYNGTVWANATGTNGIVDFHFRAITSPYVALPVADFSFDTTNAPTVSFTDLTSPAANSWTWNFGDGSTDNTQNPSHTYSQYGIYTVWLVASSANGIDSISKTVTLTQMPPVASFGYTFNGVDQVQFSDSSTNAPTQWLWDFADGSTDNVQNPVHTFTSGGNFNICLTASNAAGSSAQYCETIIVCVGIDNPSQNEIGNLYPNPILDKSFIKIDGLKSSNTVLKTYDVHGREVLIKHQITNNGIAIYRNGLSQGVYIFEIYKDNKRIKLGKIIAQ
jgi:PKD repeat protein